MRGSLSANPYIDDDGIDRLIRDMSPEELLKTPETQLPGIVNEIVGGERLRDRLANYKLTPQEIETFVKTQTQEELQQLAGAATIS